MTQESLWSSVQHPELQRVSGKIAQSVVAFCKLHSGEEFRGAELQAYVVARCGGNASSADRVMRDLRSMGVIDVELVSRCGSLYRCVGVRL